MHHKRKNKDFNPHNCGVTHFLNRVGGTWKVLVVNAINLKVNRFSTLQKAIPGASKQSLVNLLRELEEDSIIERFVVSEAPKRIDYRLTKYGKTFLPVIRVIDKWGQKDMKKMKAI